MQRTPVTITLIDANDDGELAAISHMASILEKFSMDQRKRMLEYLEDRFTTQDRT